MAQITRTNIAAIRKDVETALAGIYAKHGVDVTVGRITFTADSFRCKIEGVVRAAAGSANNAAPVSPKAMALKKYAFILGNGFDETKTYNIPSLGRVKVTGYNSKAHKYPFVVTSTSGKSYKVSTSVAKDMVARGAVA